MYSVLIVDDEPWSRKVIKQLGQWDEHQIEIAGEAEDGSEGLRMIEVLAPDIVITDMRMPGVDGVELLKLLYERYPLLKIIVMSGYDDFVYLKQAIHSQAKEYLLKPVDPDELNKALALCVKELKQSQPLADAWTREKKNKLDLAEVILHINQNFKDSITLETLADHFYITKEHLSRAFKAFQGETVTDYIQRKRMEKAKQLIIQHKVSIKHAAEMTGYTDVAYFYRVFKKHYGYAPGELRKGME